MCEYFYSDDEEGDNYDSDQEGNKFKYNNFKTWCRGKGVNAELSYIMKFGYALSSHKTNIEYPFTSFCNIRYKHPLREVELSSIETTMTEPRIYALLAAAPYWEAYKDNYADAPGTSWGYENTKGQGETRSSSHTAIFIAGYEQEFNLPLVGTQVGGVDFELNIKNTWTDSEEKSVQTTYGVDYTTFYEDAVVLTLTPYTAYYYTIVKSGNEEELGNTLMIGVPDEPRNMILSMSDYMKLRADDPSIPNLKKLFRHTVGNPWSYKKEYVDAMPVKDKNSIMWGEGEWSKWQNVGSVGAISRTISVTEEQVKTKETEFELETTLVSNTFGIKAGGGYGFNHKNAVSHMESVGHTVSATVVAPKTLEDASAKNFKWNFCRANVVFQGQNFPVVTYIVKQ